MTERLLRLPDAPLESCSSTQDLARGEAERGAPEGTVIWADAQSAGRGRGDHQWISPKGQGLWVSVVLRPRAPSRQWPALTSVSALAMAEAIEAQGSGAPTGWRIGLKWPNDLYGRHGKLGGVLAETQGPAVVLGVGVNLRQSREDFPPDLRNTASSLAIEGLAPPPDARALLLSWNERLTEAYAGFQNGGLARLREGIRGRALVLGRRVSIVEGGTQVTGRALEVGELGELLVETASGEVWVRNGEVAAIDPPL